MENQHCTKQRTSNRNSYDDSAFYNDLVYAEQQQLPSYKMQAAPRISSDILEVTNNQGAVGFVAIGRLLGHQNSNGEHYGNPVAPHVNESARSRKRNEHYVRPDQLPIQQESINHRVNESPQIRHQRESPQVRHQPVTHARHQSEPVLSERRNVLPHNSSLPNSGATEYSSTPRRNSSSSDTPKSTQHVKKSRRRQKPQRQSESEGVEQGELQDCGTVKQSLR